MRQLIVVCLATYFGTAVAFQGFTNGQFHVISSASSARVLTAGLTSNYTSNAKVVLTSWNDQTNQKWLVLEAATVNQISPTARELQPQRYFLVPRVQPFEWSTLASENFTMADLPPVTEVLSLDSVSGNLTTEVFQQTSSSQLWLAEDAGEGQIFIRNLGNNQCIKNFDKAASLLQRIFSFIRRIRQHQTHVAPNPLSTFDCNAKDVTEKWIAEL